MELAGVVAELYGLLPQDFTRTRNERAKTARSEGDKDLAEQIRRLPRPSTAAWAVNALVRHQPGEVDQVLDLGAALREAQAELDGEELRELNRQRHALLAAVTRQARGLTQRLGQPVSESIALEVEQTLRAGMADAAAAAAVRSGQLTSGLSSTGFAPVDVAGALAAPSLVEAAKLPTRARSGKREKLGAHRPKERDRRTERAVQEARQKLEDAERKAAQAEAARQEAIAYVREADERRENLDAELAELEQRMRTLQAEAAGTAREVHRAERERDQAERAADVADRAVERARERVERLGGP